MRQREARTKICVVCLFFVAALTVSAENSLPAQKASAEESVSELRLLLDKLASDNRQLRADLEQRETIIRLLTENLAVARTESDLFQKKWNEAQLRARRLGVDFTDDSNRQTQRQLVEAVRALYLAEAERRRLIEQLGRLLDAVQQQGDVAGELARTKALLASTDRTDFSRDGDVSTSGSATGGNLGEAKVLDVNPNLRLVVLNIGLLQGARVGMPLVVFRGDRVVAELKVVDVRRRICGALIERGDRKAILHAGDIARVTKNL